MDCLFNSMNVISRKLSLLNFAKIVVMISTELYTSLTQRTKTKGLFNPKANL